MELAEDELAAGAAGGVAGFAELVAEPSGAGVTVEPSVVVVSAALDAPAIMMMLTKARVDRRGPFLRVEVARLVFSMLFVFAACRNSC